MKKKYVLNLVLICALLSIAGGFLFFNKVKAEEKDYSVKNQIPMIMEYLVNAYAGLLSDSLEQAIVSKGQVELDANYLGGVLNEEVLPWITPNKYIYLTFDDGPNEPYTSEVLDILDQEGVKATFFVCGKNIEKYPDAISKMLERGHNIGNHSYSHSQIVSFIGLGTGQELEKTNYLISQFNGTGTTLYRPPWGFVTPWAKEYLDAAGYKIVLADVLSNDSESGVTPEQIKDAVAKKVKTGSIIVLHDGRETRSFIDRSNMVAALPGVIEMLKEKGYEFRLIDENTDTKLNVPRLTSLLID